MWSWSSYLPLDDACRAVDAAHLCGERVVLSTLEETHFVVHPSIDLRRVRRFDVSGNVRDSDAMVLRIRSANHFSAGVECWVTRPILKLRCGKSADASTAWAECLPWLARQAKTPVSTGRHLVNLARSHAAQSPDVSSLLDSLATGEIEPPVVVVRRRRIRSAVPSESGALFEQSDLEAGGRLWRCLCVEATNPSSLRQALGPVRSVINERNDSRATTLLVSPPQFVATILRTNPLARELVELRGQPREEGGGMAVHRISTTGTHAFGAAHGSAIGQSHTVSSGPYSRLSERLLDAWYESSDVFSQRLYRAAQAHPEFATSAAALAALRARAATATATATAEGDDNQVAAASSPDDLPSPGALEGREEEDEWVVVSPPTPPGIPEDTPPDTPERASAAASAAPSAAASGAMADASRAAASAGRASSSDLPPASPPSPSRIPVARWRGEGLLNPPTSSHPARAQVRAAGDDAAEAIAGLEAALGAAADKVSSSDGRPAGSAPPPHSTPRLPLAVPLSSSDDAARRAASNGQWRAAAHHHLPAYGVLAQFPPEVVRRAIGEAASSGDVLLLEELLNASRSAYTNMGCGVTAGTRRTPLHCAAAHGHADCVQLLLRNGRAEMSATCEGGRTAMHLAAMGGSTRHAACIRLLLRYGVGWDQPDLRGLSPVDLAREAPWRECEHLLAGVSAGFSGATQAIVPVPEKFVAANGGPLRYAMARPAARGNAQPVVGPLVTTPAPGLVGVGEERAWWCMEHPTDAHAAHTLAGQRPGLGVEVS